MGVVVGVVVGNSGFRCQPLDKSLVSLFFHPGFFFEVGGIHRLDFSLRWFLSLWNTLFVDGSHLKEQEHTLFNEHFQYLWQRHATTQAILIFTLLSQAPPAKKTQWSSAGESI